jgi:hypothetical protein
LVNKRGVPSVAKFVQLSMHPTNRPPRGTISLPSANVTIDPGQTVTFSGNATDSDGRITRYAWIFPGGTPASSTAAVPGAVRFARPGVYTVSLTVVDDDGVNDPSPPFVTVTVRGVAVTAAFSSPARGATVSGTTSVVMKSAASPATYALSIDGAVVSTQTVSGGSASYAWNTRNYANGSHTLRLTVTDRFGASATTSESVTVSNTTTAFTATITYPKAGATVAGTQSVGMSTTAPWSGSKTFKLTVDRTIVYTNTVASGTTQWFSWNTKSVANGAHTLELTVTDSAGRVATGRISVTVRN